MPFSKKFKLKQNTSLYSCNNKTCVEDKTGTGNGTYNYNSCLVYCGTASGPTPSPATPTPKPTPSPPTPAPATPTPAPATPTPAPPTPSSTVCNTTSDALAWITDETCKQCITSWTDYSPCEEGNNGKIYCDCKPTPPPPPPPYEPTITEGPGGNFPTDGLVIYYFLDNCPNYNMETDTPKCLFDNGVKVINIAFANKFDTDFTENSFGEPDSTGDGVHYLTAKYLRDQGYKGIINYSIGGQTGMCDQDLQTFFNNLDENQISIIAENVSKWESVDGVDFDIEPSECPPGWPDLPKGKIGGAFYTADIIKNKIVPLAKAIKAKNRPVTSVVFGTFLNGSTAIDMPRWFSNVDGGVRAHLMTIMVYETTVDNAPTDVPPALTVAKNLITEVPANTTMSNTYPETTKQKLFTSQQMGVGLQGTVFDENLQKEYQKVKNADFSHIAVWGITPATKANTCKELVPGNSTACVKGAYVIN